MKIQYLPVIRYHKHISSELYDFLSNLNLTINFRCIYTVLELLITSCHTGNVPSSLWPINLNSGHTTRPFPASNLQIWLLYAQSDERKAPAIDIYHTHTHTHANLIVIGNITAKIVVPRQSRKCQGAKEYIARLNIPAS